MTQEKMMEYLRSGEDVYRFHNIVEGVPEGTTVHGVYYNPAHGAFEFVVEHPEFPELKEGEFIPTLEYTVKVLERPNYAAHETMKEWLLGREDDIKNGEEDFGMLRTAFFSIFKRRAGEKPKE